MRHYATETNTPELQNRRVKGYLLCGSMVDTIEAKGERDILENSDIYIVRYSELLRKVKQLHKQDLRNFDHSAFCERGTLAKTSDGRGFCSRTPNKIVTICHLLQMLARPQTCF